MKNLKHIIVMMILMVSYQNCAPNFQANNNLDSAFSGSLGGEASPTNNQALTLYYQGLRPLAKIELESSLAEVFAPSVLAQNQWEANGKKPFDNYVEDNSYAKKQTDRSVLTAEVLAEKILTTSNPIYKRLSCLNGNKNLECLKLFINDTLPIFFRGLDTDQDKSEFYQLAEDSFEETKSFNLSLKLVTQALLLDAKFLYRKEEGVPIVKGHSQLNDLEYLNKLSFFITGRGPAADIVDKVKKGYFDDKENIESHIDSLFSSEAFLANMSRFHFDWLGFFDLKESDTFAQDSYKESWKLLSKVIYEDNSSWFNIFTSKATYVNNQLATNYGLPALPADKWRWETHSDSKRAGILGHASFLSIGVDGQETNPVKRGYHMQKTLFCGVIGPPPKDVDVDEVPPKIENGRDCKIDRVRANTLEKQGCAVCHQFMEALGFGLENYDFRGRYVAHEKDKPECDISGEGKSNTIAHTGGVINLGGFNSPQSLAEVLTQSGQISRCMVQRLVEFDIGSKIKKSDPIITKLNNKFLKSESFKDLVKYYVMLPEYRLRK